jgi:hypothetical protein
VGEGLVEHEEAVPIRLSHGHQENEPGDHLLFAAERRVAERLRTLPVEPEVNMNAGFIEDPVVVGEPGQFHLDSDRRRGGDTRGPLPVIDERATHDLEITRAAFRQFGSRFGGLALAVRDVPFEILNVGSEVTLLLPDRGRRRLG